MFALKSIIALSGFEKFAFTQPAASRLGLSDRRYPEDLEITNINLACYDKAQSNIMK